MDLASREERDSLRREWQSGKGLRACNPRPSLTCPLRQWTRSVRQGVMLLTLPGPWHLTGKCCVQLRHDCANPAQPGTLQGPETSSFVMELSHHTPWHLVIRAKWGVFE